MKKIDFVDTTLRDGHHSLWAQGMRTGMMLPVASRLDDMGFKAIEVIGSGHFKKCIRELKENPWERIELMRERIQKTPMAFMMLTSVTTFDITPFALLELYIQRLVHHGIRRIQIIESSNDMGHRMPEAVRFVKAAGAEPVVGLVYSISPRHTEEHFERKAADAVALGVKSVFIKDPAGLLTPERTRTLVPAVIRGAMGAQVEFHSHCTTGLAPVCYVEAMRLGVSTVHTAIPPLAQGSSQPSIVNVARNAGLLGYSTDLKMDAVAGITKHFTQIARQEGLPMGAPVEYDLAQYMHHVPGGVISHLRHQLGQLGREDRLEEVLREVARVREELGYPIMVTPFSQFVCSQAAFNVILGKRYEQIPDEIIQFAMGHWGREAAQAVDPDVRDRILAHPRAKSLFSWRPSEASLREIRARYGATLSDDELILRFIAPASEVEEMHRAGRPRTYVDHAQPLQVLLQRLVQKKDVRQVRFSIGDIRVQLSR